MNTTTTQPNVGDLFYFRWGYDQTQYDFIIIDSISPSGKTCLCRRAARKQVGTGSQCIHIQPVGEGWGKTFRMKIDLEDKYYSSSLRGSYIFGGGEESTAKQLGRFYPHDGKRNYHETDAMSGH